MTTVPWRACAARKKVIKYLDRSLGKSFGHKALRARRQAHKGLPPDCPHKDDSYSMHGGDTAQVKSSGLHIPACNGLASR